MEADAGVSQFKSRLALASLRAGDKESDLDSVEIASERLIGDNFLLFAVLPVVICADWCESLAEIVSSAIDSRGGTLADADEVDELTPPALFFPT